MTIIRFMTKTAFAPLLLAAAALGACSNSFIFDYEGDCDPKYRVKFHYDWHLKNSDAFAAEVEHVTLNVIDGEGNIVYTHRESGDALRQPGYEIVLDDKIKPGKYRLQAWCGKGAEPGNTSFAVHEASTLTDLRCTLLPDGDDASSKADIEGADGKEIERPLGRLFHGLSEELDFPDEEGVHTYDLGLIKDTNTVKIVLQHLSGLPIDGNLFDFTVTAANARMEHDNSLIASQPVTYHAWDIINGSAVITSEYEGMAGSFAATIAEITIGRLVYGQEVRLEAHRKSDGRLVFSVPLIPLALELKGHENRKMDNQEYLDRKDDYSFIFFLDEGYRWEDSFIYVESWKWVNQNQEI